MSPLGKSDLTVSQLASAFVPCRIGGACASVDMPKLRLMIVMIIRPDSNCPAVVFFYRISASYRV